MEPFEQGSGFSSFCAVPSCERVRNSSSSNHRGKAIVLAVLFGRNKCFV
jgi:hypothetical protein